MDEQTSDGCNGSHHGYRMQADQDNREFLSLPAESCDWQGSLYDLGLAAAVFWVRVFAATLPVEGLNRMFGTSRLARLSWDTATADRHWPRAVVLLLIVAGLFLSASYKGKAQAQDVAAVAEASATPSAATEGELQSVRPGINDNFIDPQLDISEWIERFEVESREVYAARNEVLRAIGLQRGQRVADIGAGTGFYSRLFASMVGSEGWVYAVDISPRFLEHINKQSQQDEIANITSVLGSDRSVRLPPQSVDAAFICDTYHHFEFPAATLASLYGAMKTGGTLVVIDFERIPGKSREFILGHVRGGKEVFRGEIVDAGFTFVDEVVVPGFEENYLLRFRKN